MELLQLCSSTAINSRAAAAQLDEQPVVRDTVVGYIARLTPDQAGRSALPERIIGTWMLDARGTAVPLNEITLWQTPMAAGVRLRTVEMPVSDETSMDIAGCF